MCDVCEFHSADGDESMKEKKDRRLEMAKKRLANSEVVRDLHREYTDGPDEIRVRIIEMTVHSSLQLVNSGIIYIYICFLYPVLVFKVLRLSLKPG